MVGFCHGGNLPASHDDDDDDYHYDADSHDKVGGGRLVSFAQYFLF